VYLSFLVQPKQDGEIGGEPAEVVARFIAAEDFFEEIVRDD
jgi:hypothetical protein